MSLKQHASQIAFVGAIGFALSAQTPWLNAQQANRADQGATAVNAAVPQAEDPELRPPNPPQVTFKDGALSIQASNSTLSAVLEAVRACTGTHIEIPDSAAEERLFAQLGPGPIKRVLASLLEDTDFNFLIQASDSDSTKVQTVVLMARTNSGPANLGTTATANESPTRRAWQQARRNALQSTTGQVQDSDAGLVDSTPALSTETASSVPVLPSPNPAPSSSEASGPKVESATPNIDAVAASTDPATNAGQQNATQQLIHDMRRMFEERRQLQDHPTSAQPK